MIQDQPGSCAEPRADTSRSRRRMIVSGRLARPAGPAGTGPAATVLPYMNAAVGVRVMAPRRSAAGLAARMVFS